MAIVSKAFRHSSIGITVDTYGHLLEKTASTASDATAALPDRAFDEAAAAAGDHTATTGTPAECPETAETTLEPGKLRSKPCSVGPVGIEPTTRGLKVRCSAN
jgi:hypothetical protein